MVTAEKPWNAFFYVSESLYEKPKVDPYFRLVV